MKSCDIWPEDKPVRRETSAAVKLARLYAIWLAFLAGVAVGFGAGAATIYTMVVPIAQEQARLFVERQAGQ